MKNIVLFTLTAFLLLFISACDTIQKQAVPQSVAEQLAMLPQDAQVIGFADVAKIQSSPFYKQIYESMDEISDHDDDYEKFVRETGLDPKKDIKSVYFAMSPKVGGEVEDLLVVAKGNFDPEKIMTHIQAKEQENELKETVYQDSKLYTFDDGDNAFCFVDDQSLIGGKTSSVRAYLDRSSSGPDLQKPDAAVLERVKDVAYFDGAWMVAETKSMVAKIDQDLGKMRGLKSIEKASVSMQFSDVIKFNSNGNFDNEENAILFEDALKGLIATGKLAVSEDRTVVDILNKFEIKRDGNNIEADFRITKEDVQKLIDQKQALVSQVI